MISIDQYAGIWVTHIDWNKARMNNAIELLGRVNPIIADYEKSTGKKIALNTYNKSQISGARFGGFRTQDCTTGAPHSAHKEGQAVDVMDKDNALDDWLTANPDKLVLYNLYRESPDKSLGWCHLSSKSPKSGHRTFLP